MLNPRCGKPIGRNHCARPARHRGVCSLRSADLETAAQRTGLRPGLQHVGDPRIVAELARYGLAEPNERASEQAFCELAAIVGLARSAELLRKLRAAARP